VGLEVNILTLLLGTCLGGCTEEQEQNGSQYSFRMWRER